MERRLRFGCPKEQDYLHSVRLAHLPLSFLTDQLTLEHRYLTKVADQTVVLISPAQAQSLVWKGIAEDGDEDMDMDEEDQSDRLFSFEVSKSKEQEENVTMREGFKVSLPFLSSCLHLLMRSSLYSFRCLSLLYPLSFHPALPKNNLPLSLLEAILRSHT